MLRRHPRPPRCADKGRHGQGKAHTENQPDDEHALPKGGSRQGGRVVVTEHQAVCKLHDEVAHLGKHDGQRQFEMGGVVTGRAVVARVGRRAAGSNRDGSHNQRRLKTNG